MAIRLERSDAIATIVIDRPEARNAVDGPAARALAEAFREFERDDTLRVAVLWGPGASSAPAPTSRRAAPSAACAWLPTATVPWGPPAWRSRSR